MASADVIQLRRMLSEKFPGLRMRLEPPVTDNTWPTGIARLDEPLRGGLPRAALTEITGPGDGSARLLHALLCRAASENQIIVLIDGGDSFDVTAMEEAVLSRLLWVRCRSALEAMKAADLVLRDGNLPLVLFDLKPAPEAQLRKIPATTWYRFQRLVEETGATGVVFTPRPMVAPAQVRVTLHSRFSLAALDAAEPLAGSEWEIADNRRSEFSTTLQNTA